MIECPSNYRGRQVTESNVQQYISDIVSKYLPSSVPPWQICIVPIMSSNPSRPEASEPGIETPSEIETETTTAKTTTSDQNQQMLSECSSVNIT